MSEKARLKILLEELRYSDSREAAERTEKRIKELEAQATPSRFFSDEDHDTVRWYADRLKKEKPTGLAHAMGLAAKREALKNYSPGRVYSSAMLTNLMSALSSSGLADLEMMNKMSKAKEAADKLEGKR